jgi:hypothetical protein
MQESIEYSIITQLVFRGMSGKSKSSDFLRFCGHSLPNLSNHIYYGSMSSAFVMFMQIH